MLGKLTREHAVDQDDMRAVLAAGASRQQIEDALAVCFSFNADRSVGRWLRVLRGPKAFEAGSRQPARLIRPKFIAASLISAIGRRSNFLVNDSRAFIGSLRVVVSPLCQIPARPTAVPFQKSGA